MPNTYKGIISDPAVLLKAWQRIAPRLEKQPDGCWLLLDTQSRAENYYPPITVDDYREAAHRVSYRVHKGEIPKELLIRHTCHRPRCCNPNHLIAGTITDNMRDKFEAGRCHRMIGEDASSRQDCQRRHSADLSKRCPNRRTCEAPRRRYLDHYPYPQCEA